MKSAEKLLIHALLFYLQCILSPCYLPMSVQCIHLGTCSTGQTENQNSGVFLSKDAKGLQGNSGPGEERSSI